MSGGVSATTRISQYEFLKQHELGLTVVDREGGSSSDTVICVTLNFSKLPAPGVLAAQIT